MTDQLSDLLHAGTDPVSPRLPSADAVRRSAEHHRRGRQDAATLAGLVVIVILVLVGTSQIDQLLHARTPDVVRTRPGTLLLADDPFVDPVDTGLVRTGAAPTSLSPCIISPLTWGAAEARAARSVTPGQVWPVYNEFVLRFDNAAEAHRGVAAVWREFTACPRGPAVSTDPLRSPQRYPRFHLDEWFANQRAVFGSAKMRGQPRSMYALRVARRANIVVVIEDLGVPDDRAEVLLDRALSVATKPSPK
jgi:hypothetical protein